MILQGSQRGGDAQIACHLMNALDNDHVELYELRGFVSDTLAGALKETHAISRGTKCSQYLFSLSLSPPELEKVPVEVFENAIDSIEKKLGLVGQPRAIVFHEKNGRRHAHCVWSRIDTEHMKAINMPYFKIKLQDISRQLYLENNWQMPKGFQGSVDSEPLNYSLAQAQQAKRTKIDPKTLKEMFQKCWEISDSRQAFASALQEQGFYLARGDRRGFVAVDRKGEIYSISRYVGVKAKEVRAFLGDCDDLPNVEEALGLITTRLSDKVKDASIQVEKQFEASLAEFERKRLTLVAQHKQARDTLRQEQQSRLFKDIKNRQSLLPTGMKAAWYKLSGKYQKLLKGNLAQVLVTEQRDKGERQQLIEFQLKDRRALQQQVRLVRFYYEIEIKSLWRETGENLRQFDFDPAQPLVLPIDEEAISIGAKVRKNPEFILDVITNKNEFFTRNDVLRGLAEYIDDPIALIVASDKVFQSKELVELEAKPSPLYTTQDMQCLRAELATYSGAMAGTTKCHVHSKYIKAAIQTQNINLQESVGANLSIEQEEAIRHILSSEQISVVVGFAGAGKSTMLAAAHEAWEKQGYRVFGAALSGKAADGLESSSGIKSHTLASLEHSWKHGFNELQKNDVIIIDEAGMVGSRQILRFVDKVKSRGAKLVLVGDPEQLQPIQAGTPFKDITENIGSVKLTEIRRQKEAWQREASKDLAERRTTNALNSYEYHGLVTCTDDKISAITALVEGYMSDVELRGKQASRVALTHRRKDVHMINQGIRSALKSAGELEDEILYQTDFGPRAFAPGDRILFTRNDKELGLRNGMLGTVQSVTNNNIVLQLDSDNEQQQPALTISPKLYSAIDHGFALTVHKTQGATVDHSFVLASTTMDRHLTYVALTRHKEEMNLYLDKQTMKNISRSKSQDMEEMHIQRRKRTGPTWH